MKEKKEQPKIYDNILKGSHNNARKVINIAEDQQRHDLVSDTNNTINKLNNYNRSNFHHK